MSVGYDHIDIEACKIHNVVLGHTPGVLTDATADFTMAILVAATRRIVEGATAVRQGKV